MPSFFHSLSSLSCRNANAVIGNLDCRNGPSAVHDDKEMLNAFTGYRNHNRSSPFPSPYTLELNNTTKEEGEVLFYPPINDATKTELNQEYRLQEEGIDQVKQQDHSSRRSMRSMRSMSKRSTLSRMDSCNTNISSVSIRSSPWKHISTNILFWNDKNQDASNTENRILCKQEVMDDEYIPNTMNEETSTENEDEDVTDTEDEYVFLDDTESEVELSAPIIIKPETINVTPISQEVSALDTISMSSPTYNLSSLLGPTVIRSMCTCSTNTSIEVDTKFLQQQNAFIGIYYANAEQCIQTTEYIHLFTSGYNLHDDEIILGENNNDVQGLSIVFINADEISDNVPTNMPSYWYTLSSSKKLNEQKRLMCQQLDIVDTSCGPTLVIIDPMSGNIISSNAINDIVALNRTDSQQYDMEACQLYDKWIQQLHTMNTNDTTTYEQVTCDHEIVVEYVDDERNEYETSLPYEI